MELDTPDWVLECAGAEDVRLVGLVVVKYKFVQPGDILGVCESVLHEALTAGKQYPVASGFCSYQVVAAVACMGRPLDTDVLVHKHATYFLDGVGSSTFEEIVRHWSNLHAGLQTDVKKALVWMPVGDLPTI